MSSMRETITLNTQEQRRVMVLSRILARHLSAAEAASELSLSPRQVQRILAAYRKEGGTAFGHGNRDRKPKHTMGEEVRKPRHSTGHRAGCGM
jgi:transposase